MPKLIRDVYRALKNPDGEPGVTHTEAERDFLAVLEPNRHHPAPVSSAQAPAVEPENSIFPDYIICLEDGRKFKTLRRHLKAEYNMTPEQYREKWHLDADYPMVAPNYSTVRSNLAKESRLGGSKQAA
jgi:predicted transcriptional regulator